MVKPEAGKRPPGEGTKRTCDGLRGDAPVRKSTKNVIFFRGKHRTILLVGGLEHFLFVFGRIIPTDQYFSEGLKPPTSFVFSYSYVTLLTHKTGYFLG